MKRATLIVIELFAASYFFAGSVDAQTSFFAGRVDAQTPPESNPHVEASWKVSENFSEVELCVTNIGTGRVQVWDELGGTLRGRRRPYFWVTPADPIKDIVVPIVSLRDVHGNSINFRLGWIERAQHLAPVEPTQRVKLMLSLPTGLAAAVVDADAREAVFSLLYNGKSVASAAFFKLDKWQNWK